MKIMYIASIILFLLTGCKKENDKDIIPLKQNSPESIVEETTTSVEKLINPEGMIIAERYFPPKGFERVQVSENSFGEFLRNQNLKSYGEKVLYYDGREKNKKGVYDSVFDVDIGGRDLHQCADAIMLLRAEYLYSQELYDKIHFNFVSGFKAEYSKWMEGYRIKIDGNNVSYYKATDPTNSYESFRKYMDMVFAYSGTLSLDKELESAKVEEMSIGDVFIIGGSPGHAVIVVDMAEKNLYACSVIYACTTNPTFNKPK